MAEFGYELRRRLAETAAQGLRRELRRVQSPVGRSVRGTDQTLVNFAANDYLGLANHPAVLTAAAQATHDYGAGSGASRLLSGSLTIHHQLEERLAEWKGTEAALIFSSGYAAALGVIPALLGRNDVVILDKRAHACCVDAARLSGAKLRIFRHNDLNHLADILQWADARKRGNPDQQILIITESIFSMDGDQAPLPDLVRLKDQYGAWLWLDEAHALGLLGANRAGLAEATGLTERIEVQMGTLGKALGAAGGYIAGSRTLIDFVINHARSFVFSTAPVPAASAAALAALEIVRAPEGSTRRERVWQHARLVAARTQPGQPATSAILPVILGAEDIALNAARDLRAQGLWVPAIRFPTVARRQARLRIGLSASHTVEDIDQLITALRPLVAGHS